MNNVEQAAGIIKERHRNDQLEGDGVVGCFDAAAAAQTLADAGLLAPEPQIIRSAEDLMRVDGDSLIATHEEVASTTFGAHYMCYAADPEAMIYPMVVVATGEQVRAARTALQEATE